MMKPVSYLYILGPASEPVSVIAIYQGLRVNEAMTIVAGHSICSEKIFTKFELWDVQQH